MSWLKKSDWTNRKKNLSVDLHKPPAAINKITHLIGDSMAPECQGKIEGYLKYYKNSIKCTVEGLFLPFSLRQTTFGKAVLPKCGIS